MFGGGVGGVLRTVGERVNASIGVLLGTTSPRGPNEC